MEARAQRSDLAWIESRELASTKKHIPNEKNAHHLLIYILTDHKRREAPLIFSSAEISGSRTVG